MTPYLQRHSLFPPLISNRPSLVLRMIIIIPCHDEPQALRTLLSVQKCTLPQGDVEVIVVVNDSESAHVSVKQRNQATYELLSNWAKKQSPQRIKFHVLYQQGLPKKHAGVGLARKIGMDEAIWRFEKAGNKNGILVCLDADAKVQANYLIEIENFFASNQNLQAASIHFEHPLTGIEYEEEIYESIILYELHLRYFIHAQRWAGFPFAYQTIGSSMAVRADAYQQQGGMNRRKAGEDFYFLHKFIELRKVGNLTTTTVIPSPRCSHRVPFGTGKAVQEIMQRTETYTTYAPQSFEVLKRFFSNIDVFTNESDQDKWWKVIPYEMQCYLDKPTFVQKITEIRHNTKNTSAFTNRFFRWFNAFQLMKFVHYCRDKHFPNVSLETATQWLSIVYDYKATSKRQMLKHLRILDQKGDIIT